MTAHTNVFILKQSEKCLAGQDELGQGRSRIVFNYQITYYDNLSFFITLVSLIIESKNFSNRREGVRSKAADVGLKWPMLSKSGRCLRQSGRGNALSVFIIFSDVKAADV